MFRNYIHIIIPILCCGIVLVAMDEDPFLQSLRLNRNPTVTQINSNQRHSVSIDPAPIVQKADSKDQTITDAVDNKSTNNTDNSEETKYVVPVDVNAKSDAVTEPAVEDKKKNEHTRNKKAKKVVEKNDKN